MSASMGKCLLMAVAVCLFYGGAAAREAHRLTIPAGEIRFDETGISLIPSFADCPSSKATDASFWSLVLEPAQGSASQRDVVVESRRQLPPSVKETKDELTLVYPNLTDGTERLEIGLTLIFRSAGDCFEIGGEIQNGTKQWIVKGFTGPGFTGIHADLAKTPLLMPNGFGYRIRRVPSDDKDNLWPWRKAGKDFVTIANFPSAGGTMQWFAFAGEAAGLYLGAHDPRCRAKALKTSYDPEQRTFLATFQHRFYLLPGERGTIPTVVVQPYQGDWHTAARIYRTWVDSVSKQIEKPAWVKTASGWLLAILKQQNGEIMWPYDTLDKLSEIADERGLDILGLFGWGYGGHDHLYPDYNPCPLMGGEKGLREGIKKAHACGKRVILYANGQLIERGTAFWTDTGRHLAVTNKDGSTVQEFWHKYKDTPGYHFDIGCNVAQAWRERLLALAKQANEFGADGILYDQLGVRGPMACYGEGHGHPVPAMVYEYDRKEMLRDIAQTMKGVNPDFIVMTEGFFDALLDSIIYFHGCVEGVFEDSADRIVQQQVDPQRNGLFPEMVRYTYPEVACTVRVPSPLIDRAMANYTCVYGWRWEIESRYAPDRDYLVSRRIPKLEDYSQVLNKPNIARMQTFPFEEAAGYMKSMTNFQKKNARLLMTGAFTDTEGFTCKGTGIVAKGFSSGDLVGVIVWNTSDKSSAFALDVPGAEFVSASEPQKSTVEAFDELAPQTIRLLVWKRPARK